MNYGESAPVTINMTIAFDNASQGAPQTSGIGFAIGRTVGDVVTGAGAA
jgi:hypothetical protein